MKTLHAAEALEKAEKCLGGTYATADQRPGLAAFAVAWVVIAVGHLILEAVEDYQERGGAR